MIARARFVRAIERHYTERVTELRAAGVDEVAAHWQAFGEVQQFGTAVLARLRGTEHDPLSVHDEPQEAPSQDGLMPEPHDVQNLDARAAQRVQAGGAPGCIDA